jgi:hypothetical protein
MPTAVDTFVTVTGTYSDLNGRAGYGYVEFIPDTQIFEDSADETIYTKTIYRARVDAYGKLSIKVPTTSQDGLTPPSFTYTVVENVTGMKKRRTNGVTVPANLGSTVPITQLI